MTIVNNAYFGHIIVFIVVGSLIGYSPMSAGLIRKTRRTTDSIRRFLTKASVLSLLIAIIVVGLFDYYARFIPWASIPKWFWYIIGVFFAGVALKKYLKFLKCKERAVLYNALWFALAGVLITMYETMLNQGTGGMIITIIVILLAVLVRYCYWKQLHHHAKEKV